MHGPKFQLFAFQLQLWYSSRHSLLFIEVFIRFLYWISDALKFDFCCPSTANVSIVCVHLFKQVSYFHLWYVGVG
jgi:hypothetical protein